jgi:hypothetical protein
MPFAHPGNVPITYEGRTQPPRGFRALFGWLRPPGKGSRRPDRSTAGDAPDDGDEPGAAGAGRTAPLVPRTPVLSGSNARKLGEE